MYKQVLALKNLHLLIYYETKPNQTKYSYLMQIIFLTDLLDLWMRL